ncbi:TolC family protein [Thioclava sp. JE_KL1]|uniref:TolC family protein n=1 Tax=Thioclava sp. JE_KL1 TaxID=2651187 RepID=UPI00128C4CEA|nr:TolC family protein [Thioclava sp. JE_KL1]MPQ95990.1 TolC family protein [Thioclava sp. JE_KL1]
MNMRSAVFHSSIASTMRARAGLIAAGLGVFLFMAPPLHAQSLSLQQALQIATNRDASVASMRQKVARKTTDIKTAKDALKPSFQFAGDTSSAGANIPTVSLTLSQVLFDWGYARSNIESASQERVKAVTKLKRSVEDLAFDVSQLFIAVAIDNRKLQKTQDYLTFAKRIEGVSHRRVAGGVADSSEIARARLEVARAEDQIAQLEADRQTALAQLEFYIGHPVTTLRTPPDLRVTDRFKSSAEMITATIEAPDYLSVQADVAIARANVKKAKAARKPKIVLKARGLQELNNGRSRSASIGLTTSLDFDASDLSGRATQAAQQDLTAAKSSQLAVERKLQNQLRTYVQQAASLAKTEDAQSRQLQQAQKVRQSYEKQFSGGKRKLVEVLTSARDFYDAQIDQLDTSNQRLQTEYEAAHSIGMLGSLIIATNKR